MKIEETYPLAAFDTAADGWEALPDGFETFARSNPANAAMCVQAVLSALREWIKGGYGDKCDLPSPFDILFDGTETPPANLEDLAIQGGYALARAWEFFHDMEG